MSELLSFLLVFSAILLLANGGNDAFCIEEDEDAWSLCRTRYGGVKFMFALITLIMTGWELYVYLK